MPRNNRDLDELVLEAGNLISDLRVRSDSKSYRASVRAAAGFAEEALEKMSVAAKSLALLKLDGRHRAYIDLCFSPSEPETDAIGRVVSKIQETQFALRQLNEILYDQTFSKREKKAKYKKLPPKYLDETIEFINFFEQRTGNPVVFPKRATSITRRKGWESDFKYVDQPSTYFVCKCLRELDGKIDISRGITLIRLALKHQQPLKEGVAEILSRKN
jgi:hypothetical protein